jgi:hypothetical protein
MNIGSKLKVNQTAVMTYLPSERFTYEITRVLNTAHMDGWIRGTAFSLNITDNAGALGTSWQRFDAYLDARTQAEKHHRNNH